MIKNDPTSKKLVFGEIPYPKNPDPWKVANLRAHTPAFDSY